MMSTAFATRLVPWRPMYRATSVPDLNRILQAAERFDQRREILGAGIQIVAVPRPAGSPVTAAIVANAAISSQASAVNGSPG